MKRSPLTRKTRLQRGGPIARRSNMRRVNPRRLEELKRYWARVPMFLREHPYCQLTIALYGLSEASVIRCAGLVPVPAGPPIELPDQGTIPRPQWITVPRSQEVHHRNKRRGDRLLDESEWRAASSRMHDWVEHNKAWARRYGLLLPI